ncbi:ParB N-terminal domain-containing protein [Solidesulfovibrio carbinolicus]|uniref:Chromosome partitioning protein ParB n=1 Tax=Solidesulfovibrio carbinolicus TaxID=296842 RepID=A0A4P6HRE0_9BACT|nr:ParB-like nuclease domain-containing protein [Solidesulfovibrio carbinolicus]QAZ69314.1 chromosome partitioning protein ParB [Solidesulfovibrio carbinolicus]
MQPLFLHPRDIDLSAPHLFWAAPPDAALTDSLAALGQVTPALVIETDGRPILAAGSRRAAALREIKGRTLCALALPEADPETHPQAPDGGPLPLALRLGLIYLATNLGRAVTDAMAVAAGRYFAPLAGVDGFLALAGPLLFAPDDRRGRLLARWLTLPPALDAWLASGHVPLGAGERLAALDPDDLNAFMPLLGAVRWSRGSLSAALTFLTEAARLAGETPAATLTRSGLLDLPGRGLSPNDLTAGLLAGLRRLRYPAVTTLEARFTALSRELSRGSRVKIRPSQGFESDSATFEVTVKNRQELSKAAADLAAMAVAPALPRLLSVAQEEMSEEPGEKT